MRFSKLFPVILIVFSCNSSTEKKEDAAEVGKIRSVREYSNQAIERKDTAAMASVWTTDYHIVTSRNFEVMGRIANRDRFFNEFVSKPDVIYVRMPVTIEVFDKWNMASETGTWIGHWTEQGTLVELSGSYFAKWHRLNGTWRIRAEVFVPLKCVGGDFCNESPIK